jgi:hypothetical protein
MTRIEIDEVADQVQPDKRAEFVEAAWAATVLCWDEIPSHVRHNICQRTAMLLGVKYRCATNNAMLDEGWHYAFDGSTPLPDGGGELITSTAPSSRGAQLS